MRSPVVTYAVSFFRCRKCRKMSSTLAQPLHRPVVQVVSPTQPLPAPTSYATRRLSLVRAPLALLAVCRSLLAPFTISSERDDVAALSPESPDVAGKRGARGLISNVPPYRIEYASHKRHELLY